MPAAKTLTRHQAIRPPASLCPLADSVGTPGVSYCAVLDRVCRFRSGTVTGIAPESTPMMSTRIESEMLPLSAATPIWPTWGQRPTLQYPG